MNKALPQSKTQQHGNDAAYFNLHTAGCGYLSRVRWVNPQQRGGRKSIPFLACAINALRGEVESPAYTYFDVIVTGDEAIRIVSNLEQHVAEKCKVFVAFKLGDIYTYPYERGVAKDGKLTGEKEWTALIKGRLLLITHVKVDGETVYQRADESQGTDEGKRQRSDDTVGSAQEDADTIVTGPQGPLRNDVGGDQPVRSKHQASRSSCGNKRQVVRDRSFDSAYN